MNASAKQSRSHFVLCFKGWLGEIYLCAYNEMNFCKFCIHLWIKFKMTGFACKSGRTVLEIPTKTKRHMKTQRSGHGVCRRTLSLNRSHAWTQGSADSEAPNHNYVQKVTMFHGCKAVGMIGFFGKFHPNIRMIRHKAGMKPG